MNPEIHQCQLQWATCVLIVCNYFRTPFPRPWQYRPPVALLGTAWWKLSVHWTSLPTTVPSPPSGQDANAMGMAFQDEARQRQRHRCIRHGIACHLRQDALHLWCKGPCLATGKFWQWKTIKFPFPNMSKLEMCWSWSFETSIFFLHRFPTYFDCWFFLLPSYTSQCLRRSLMGDPEGLDGVFCIRLQWSH